MGILILILTNAVSLIMIMISISADITLQMRFNIGLTGAILIIFGNICASVILYFPHKPSGLIPIKSVGRLRVGLTSSDNEIMNDSIPCSKDLEKNLQKTKKIG